MSLVLRRAGCIAVVLLAMTGSTMAQALYRGNLSVRYELHDYAGAAAGLISSDMLRQLFLHSVEFAAQHGIGGGKLGTLHLGVALNGYYDHARVTEGRVSNYYAPDLENLSARLALSPRSRLTLSSYYASSHAYQLTYENKNRFIVTTERPVLAIVRKYENRQRSIGGRLGLSVNSALSFDGTYERSSGTLLRLYDFGEDRDIFSQVVPQQQASPQSEYFVVFINELPDTVTVFIDDTVLVSNLSPGDEYLATVDAGLHRFIIAARAFNTFEAVYDVSANLSWIIRYNEPSAPNDRETSRNNAVLGAVYAPSEKVENALSVRLESSDDAFTLSRSNSKFVSNSLSYRPNARLSIQARSSYSRLGTATGDRPEDVQTAIGHTTSLDLLPDARSTVGVFHSITRSSRAFATTTINSLEGTGKREFSRRYTADLKMRASHLAGEGGLTRRDISLVGGQQLADIRLLGTRSAIIHGVDWKRSTQSTRPKPEGQYGSRVGVVTDFGSVGPAGKVTTSVGQSLQWLVDQTGTTRQSGVSMGLAITNDNLSWLTCAGGFQYYRTITAGTGTQTGRAVSNTTADLRANARLSARSSLNAGLTLQEQKDLSTRRFMMTFAATLPYVGAEYKHTASISRKDFAELGTEVDERFEQSVLYRWRSIMVEVHHAIVYERLRSGSARYQSVMFQANRRFSL